MRPPKPFPGCRLGIEEPTWEEFYGASDEAKPFDDFFKKPGDDDDYMQGINGVSLTWPIITQNSLWIVTRKVSQIIKKVLSNEHIRKCWVMNLKVYIVNDVYPY